MRKSVFGVSDLVRHNVQSQKMARGLNFLIKKVEGSYYLCSKKRCWSASRLPVFSRRGSYVLFVSCLFVLLVISQFGFRDRSLVLVPVPGYCFIITFTIGKCLKDAHQFATSIDPDLTVYLGTV